MIEAKGTASARSLGDFLDHEVYPHLSVEDIFTDPAHAWKERGTKWKGGCPWHESKSGSSFTVDPESLRWNCAGGCGGGSPTQYLHGLKTGTPSTPFAVDFLEIAKELARRAGVPFPERELSEEEKVAARAREARRTALDVVISRAEEVLWSPAGEEARAYLETGRGFVAEEIRSLRLGFYDSTEAFRVALEKAGVETKDVVDSFVLRPKMEGFIVVPWLDDRGRPLTLYGRWKTKVPPLQKDHPAYRPGRDKARAEWEARKASGVTVGEWTEPEVPKTTALPGDDTKASPLYFDRARAAGEREVVLVEGVFDAALPQVRGDARVVASVGAVASKLQVETLVRNRVKAVYICGDPDKGGDAGTLNNIRNLTAAGISTYVVPRLPEGLDPDEFILRHGIDAWRKRVLEAVPGSVFRAGLALQGVTPTSPEKERREVVGKVLAVLEDLTGPEAALDEETIRLETADRTGYTAEALAEVAAAYQERRKAEKKKASALEVLQKARDAAERGDEDPVVLLRSGVEKLSALEKDAEPEPPWFDEERLWNELAEVPVGRPSGWAALDGMGVRFHAGELAILGARPGHAKTSVLAGLLWNWLRDSEPDEVFLFYSFEELERQVYRRLLSLASVEAAPGRRAWGRDEIRDFRTDPEGNQTEEGWPPPRILEAARARLAPMRERFALVRRPEWTAEEIAAHALRQKERGLRVSGVFVDYLQLVREPKNTRVDRPDIGLSLITQRLKNLAVELDAPVVSGAQMGRGSIPPNFTANVQGAGSYPEATPTIRTARPDLQHLRGGGMEHGADLVVGLLNYRADYREAVSKAKDIPAVTLLEMGTLKAREGNPGLWAPLAFEGRYGLVRDMTEEEERSLRPEDPPSRAEVARVKAEERTKRSADSLEREKVRLETAREKTQAERLRLERLEKAKSAKKGKEN